MHAPLGACTFASPAALKKYEVQCMPCMYGVTRAAVQPRDALFMNSLNLLLLLTPALPCRKFISYQYGGNALYTRESSFLYSL